MSRRPSRKVCMAPMAVASDGALLINVAATYGPGDPQALLERALAEGRPVFIGVVLTAAKRRFTMKWLEDAAVEASLSIRVTRPRRRSSRRPTRMLDASAEGRGRSR